MNLPETELIKRCKDGDRNAFNELFAMYENKVINIAYGMLSDREDAYDAAQEVFIKVYKNIASFKENSSLSTWIYRITSNTCNDILRKRQRSVGTVSINSTYDEEEKDMELKDTAPTPAEFAEMTETQRAVREAISELSDEYREVITLCDIEDLSYDEISGIINCPVGTVKSRINRARNALKKKLSEKRELFF